MTREERIEKLRHLITCMKCEVSGKCCDDNCSTQYDAGNMGEIIENLEEIAKALEQEPCEDAISRQAVLEIQTKYAEHIGATKFWQMRDDIKELSPVTPQPKTGHWIYTGDYITEGMLKCSSCGYEHDVADRFLYCPNCGAKMEEQK